MRQRMVTERQLRLRGDIMDGGVFDTGNRDESVKIRRRLERDVF